MIDFGLDLAGDAERNGPDGPTYSLRGASLVAAAGALVEAMPVWIVVYALGEAFVGRSSALRLDLLTFGLVVLLAATYALKVAGAIGTFGATYALACRLRLRLAEHLRRLPMGFWTARHRGQIGNVLTTQFDQYTEIFTHVWSMVVVNVVYPLALGAGLFALDPWVALATLLPVLPAMFAISWTLRVLNAASDELAAEVGETTDRIIEYVEGIATFRAFGRAGDANDVLRDRLDRLEATSMKTELVAAPAIMTYSMVVYGGFVLGAFAAAWRVESGGLAAPAAVLALLVAALFVRAQASLVLYLAESRFAARTLARVRELFGEPEQASGTLTPPIEAPVLEVRDVSFAHAADESEEPAPTLRRIGARFAPGTVTALVGPSGSGKSTFAHLLLRLWDVDAGVIRLGGFDVRDLSLAHLHRHVAMVFQEVVLFETSVLDNLRLARPEASREEVEAAARRARIHDVIAALPEGYDTVLGPGGAGLSGGERQRLSIARALLRDAPILVLDEATASLDPASEAAVQAAVGELMAGRTVVVIAHRLWTIKHADAILVFDQGRIVERGTHEALVQAGGTYARLWEAQQTARGWSLSA